MLLRQKLGQPNVTSLVERVSRFTVLPKTPDRRTEPVTGKIVKAVRGQPRLARKSIAFDRGAEFASWPHLQAGTGMQTWFCDLSSPLSGHCRAMSGRAMPGRRERSRTPTGAREDGCREHATSRHTAIMI